MNQHSILYPDRFYNRVKALIPKSDRYHRFNNRKVPHIYWDAFCARWRVISACSADYTLLDQKAQDFVNHLNQTKQAHPILPEGDS